MSLIHEYGENKYQTVKDDGIEEGIEKIMINLLKSGDEPELISEKAEIPIEKVLEIKNKNGI